jgi:hypothetical protein
MNLKIVDLSQVENTLDQTRVIPRALLSAIFSKSYANRFIAPGCPGFHSVATGDADAKNLAH